MLPAPRYERCRCHNTSVLLSIPGLRERDLSSMPNLGRLATGGGYATLVPSFPAVTCPVQANMTTGLRAARARRGGQRLLLARSAAGGNVDRLERLHPEAADLGHAPRPRPVDHVGRVVRAAQQGIAGPITSARPRRCTMPTAANRPGASPGPIRCTTSCRPSGATSRCTISGARWREFNRRTWIVDSAIFAAQKYRPNFFYIYLPHLDYAAQKSGPDSKAAKQALGRVGYGNRQAGGRL